MDIVQNRANRVKRIFLFASFLESPFFDLVTLFSLILIKELHVSSKQLAIFLALKPACSLLSPYWSSIIHRRQDLLKSNLLLAYLVGYAPFLFFPWYANSWMMVGCVAIYWVMTKGMKPAWLEMINVTAPKKERERVCASSLKIHYCSNLLFPFLIGRALDLSWIHWEWLFFLFALIAIGAVPFLLLLPKIAEVPERKERGSFFCLLYRPWKDVGSLLVSNRPFFRFQLSFFFAGAGLILFYPALKQFLALDLALSYTAISLVSIASKGIGFLTGSPFWVKQMEKSSILSLSQWVMWLAFLFPYILLLGLLHVGFVCLAYLLYGVMQAGSGLVWHLSGPYYAKEGSSSVYSSTNLLTVGVRGAIFPLLGGFLLEMTTAPITLIMGSGVIFVGIVVIHLCMKQEKKREALSIANLEEIAISD